MTASAFISTLQRGVYEYGAVQHTSVSSNMVYSAHPSPVQPGNNLFKCVCVWESGMGGAMSLMSLVIGVTTNSTFV